MDKLLLAVKYVDGELSDRENMAFEDAVRYDGELQSYLASYKDIYRSVNEELKSVLTMPRFETSSAQHFIDIDNFDETNEKPYVAEKITYGLDYLWFIGWAAAIVIALLVWKPWKKDLYEEFGFNNKVIASKLVAAPYQGFNDAAQFLEQKDYYEAKRIVSKSFTQNPEDFKLASYYVMLLLADNCLETGREVLYPFAEGKSIYKQEAAYMLALTYLKSGDTQNCKFWLSKIDASSSYHAQSVQLLAKLDGTNTKSDFI